MTKKSTMSPGDPIESRCTKCRKITNHVIVALKDEVPVKVECNTCGGHHMYRPPAAARKSTKRTVSPQRTASDEWQLLQPEMSRAKAIQYTMDTPFKVGNVIQHSAFGLGLVQKVLGPQKVEVLFEAGKKMMCCGAKTGKA